MGLFHVVEGDLLIFLEVVSIVGLKQDFAVELIQPVFVYVEISNHIHSFTQDDSILFFLVF